MKFDLAGSLSPQPKPASRKTIHIGRADKFVADTHFGHAFMLQHREFPSIEAHDEFYIERWNKVVGKTDTVYFLGDFSHPRVPIERRQEIFDRLKGKKIILPGNQDDDDTLSLPWHAVLHGPQHFRDGLGNVVVCLHWPMAEWDGWHSGSLHMHGHSHGNRISSRRRFDVGVDNGGSYPQTWSEIKARMDQLPELDFNGVLIEPWKPDRGYLGPH